MYFQYPTVYGDHLVFVCNDSLWRVHKQGGPAERLTECMERMSFPVYSPDGKQIAFSAQEDIYLLSTQGGIAKRLTYVNAPLSVAGWSSNSQLLMTSAFQNPFRESFLYEVDLEDGAPRRIELGPCEFASSGPTGGKVIQRRGYGYIPWKRYQGGAAGRLWIDRKGDGDFVPLLPEISHNLLRPLWIGERIYFLSDYEGKGNLYSCGTEGQDVRRHTHHNDFYVRQHSTDGKTIAYSCGGQLYLLEEGQVYEVPIQFHQEGLEAVRKSVKPSKYLTSYKLSSDGKKVALTTRGRLFQMTPYKGPASQRGERNGVRYRLACWLKDGTLLALCDQGNQEVWDLFEEDRIQPVCRRVSSQLDWGRIINAKPSPCDRVVVCTNHRHELLWIQLDSQEEKKIDLSPKGPVQGYDWSPCGRWVVYSLSCQYNGSSLWLYDTHQHEKHCLIDGKFSNVQPVFDREGKYIYFLSARSFEPSHDELHFHMSFHNVRRPFALVLKKGEESPFFAPFLGEIENGEKHAVEEEGPESKSEGQTDEEKAKKAEIKPTVIDLEGIADRLVAFPVPPRSYVSLASLKGQVLYMVAQEKNELYSYDLSDLKEDQLLSSLDSMTLSQDGQWMMYEVDHKLRTVRAGTKPDESPDPSFRRGGWLDWDRISLVVSPRQEWRHMFDEAWRLQKELFWTPRMGQVNWDEVYQRYRPCVERISCLSELWAVISDLHGELGTSHAYIIGLPQPCMTVASLGAELQYEPEQDAYRITRILEGDTWEGSPLRRPGLNVQCGDLLWSIRGQALSAEVQPAQLLDYQAGQVIPLEISDSKGENRRTIVVSPLPGSAERHIRYREWVEANRKWVHEKTGGRAGYIHIPDMQAFGYGEFLRSFLQEFDREGLIVDARYNGGGNISPLVLDLLTRKRLGYDQSRHQGAMPYPAESPKGPLVALINEHTASDGDIFSQSFRTLNLGPLVGKRTWGGVVGIWPRYSLLDGTCTTQPEYSFWFHEVGWRVENYGVDPTIEVEITPSDYRDGRDSQLQRGVEELMILIEKDQERQKKLQTPPEEPCLVAPLLEIEN